MKESMRKNVLQISMLSLCIVVSVLFMAVPALADDTTNRTRSPITNPALHALDGKVVRVTSNNSTITIISGNQTQINIKLDRNTKYFLASMGENNNDNNKDKDGIDMEQQSKGADSKELHIPSNWKTDLNWVERFHKKAAFSDIKVGDRVIAWVTAPDNLAKQVLIIKIPIIQTVKGVISAVSGHSITISPNKGTPLTLTWDVKTRFDLRGLISVQNGQYAVATYNRITMLAQLVTVTATIP
jgi:hypothetical protein